MHYAISTTWGPTDTTRASLPFIFAASALQVGDTVMIMLFHDAVAIAVEGAHPKMVPFGPPQKFEDVFSNQNAPSIDSVHVGDKIQHLTGVAPLIVIPRHDFDEVWVQPDSRASIKDACTTFPNEVR